MKTIGDYREGEWLLSVIDPSLTVLQRFLKVEASYTGSAALFEEIIVFIAVESGFAGVSRRDKELREFAEYFCSKYNYRANPRLFSLMYAIWPEKPPILDKYDLYPEAGLSIDMTPVSHYWEGANISERFETMSKEITPVTPDAIVGFFTYENMEAAQLLWQMTDSPNLNVDLSTQIIFIKNFYVYYRPETCPVSHVFLANAWRRQFPVFDLVKLGIKKQTIVFSEEQCEH